MDKTYKYRWQIFTQIWIGWLLHIIVLWGFGFSMIRDATPQNDNFIAGLCFIGFSIIGTLICMSLHSERLPITISNEGITFSRFLGLRNKFVRWEEVRRIEEVHFPDTMFNLNWNPFKREWIRYQFIGEMPNKSIFWVDSGLKDLRCFLDDLNLYIQEYHIPLLYVNLLPSAVEKIRSSRYNLATQKKLRAEGLRHSLAKL